jgi:DNA-binding Xre family transcriptional regulator
MEQKAGYKLSAPSLSALLTESPKQMKAQTMDALCTALDCTPADLWQHTPSLIQMETLERGEHEPPKAVNDISKRSLPPI